MGIVNYLQLATEAGNLLIKCREVQHHATILNFFIAHGSPRQLYELELDVLSTRIDTLQDTLLRTDDIEKIITSAKYDSSLTGFKKKKIL